MVCSVFLKNLRKLNKWRTKKKEIKGLKNVFSTCHVLKKYLKKENRKDLTQDLSWHLSWSINCSLNPHQKWSQWKVGHKEGKQREGWGMKNYTRTGLKVRHNRSGRVMNSKSTFIVWVMINVYRGGKERGKAGWAYSHLCSQVVVFESLSKLMKLWTQKSSGCVVTPNIGTH